MPVHDRTRVDAGTFHHFHTLWLSEMATALNTGVLPPDYYAMAEQIATRRQTDVLTLSAIAPRARQGGITVLEAPPPVRLRTRGGAPKARVRSRRRITVRHITGHSVVAVIEVVSPANKGRRQSVRELSEKIIQLLEADVQALVIDLLPPGRHDPQGMHGAVWSHFDPAGYTPPTDEPLTLASYRWDDGEPEAFVEPVAVGRALIDMPLFLNSERYVNVPLERTYQEAYRGVPAFWRGVIEGTQAPPT
jgi:hypothetical protein